LRSGGTLFSLQKLHDKRHISGSDFHHLTVAYEFLRCIEHRLQLWRGQQTHRVPDDPQELEILARSMLSKNAEPNREIELLTSLREKMGRVSEIYDRIIHQQQQRSEQGVGETFALRSTDVEFGRVPSDQQVLQRLNVDNPALYRIASRTDLEAHTRRNLFKFLSSAFTSAERYRAVAAAPLEVQRAMELFRTSEFLTDILSRHPEDVASLSELRTSSARHQPEILFPTDDLVRGGHSRILEDYLASGQLPWAEKMALMRRRFRYRTFLSGARDVLESRPVSASLRDTTEAAEEAISGAWAVVGRPEDMTVLALGRLGSMEFDFLSDADLVFVRSQQIGADEAARIVEEFVRVLSAYTNEGSVMAVDLRLRPHGSDGAMVVTPEQLETYFEHEAHPWEALTYTKLRRIAGSEIIADQAQKASERLKDRFASESTFGQQVREMRAKLDKSDAGLKTKPGGTYDIDFLVAYTSIKHGVHTVDGTLGQRLQKLNQAGFLSKPDLQVLLDALELYRTTEHVIRLVTGRPGKAIPVSETAQMNVMKLVARTMTRDPGAYLEEHLEAVRAKVREIFDRALSE